MRGFLLLLSVCAVMMSAAQEPSLYFEKITVQNGLSHNKVNCIIQDKRGFIWMGTDDGLNRYDGTRFLHFRARPNDSTTLSGNIITDLLEDKEGRIWIATSDGGLSRFDHRLPQPQQFRQYRHIPGKTNSIPVNTIHSLVEDRLGFLWLGTGGRSVLRFDKTTEQFVDITKSAKTILDMTLDRDGMIWVGRQGGGLMKINPNTFSYTEDDRYRDLYAKLPHVTVTALFKDRQHHVWFGSWDKVVYRLNAISGKEEVFTSGSAKSFNNDEILSFAEDKTGRLWMGGKEKGLHIFDPSTGNFYNYNYNPAKEGSVSDNRINCIFIDKDGRVWLGTNRGVCINNPDKQQFVQQFLNDNTDGPVTIYHFYEDDDKSLWIGTSQGIFIKKPDGTLQHKRVYFKNSPLHVTYFFKDTDGSFYLGTDYSLFRYNVQNNTVSLLANTEKDGVMNRIIDSRVVSVVKDRIDGRPVLLTSPYGHFIAYYDLDKKRWVSRLDTMNIVDKFNLKDNLVRKFYKTKNGSIWMATVKYGIGLWTTNSLPRVNFFGHDPADPFSISSNNIYDIKEDDQGNLWIATYGGGLNYMNIRTKKFTQVASTNNLLEGIEIDRHQNVWMVSNGHLHKYNPFKKSYESFDLPDLEKTGGVKGSIFKDNAGRLYVSGTNFFISVDPDSISGTQVKPRVYLTDFQIFNRSFSHLLEKDKIVLNYRDNYFSFEFSAPDFSTGREVRYSYMLEGFDNDWVDAGARNYVSYPNLEGGNYVFKVRATNMPGSWSNEIASVNIRIIPPFWKRAWFYIACAVLLALAVYVIYRYRINELLKRQAIRNRIAQDLHDNVGSTLSSISVYSQVARIYHEQQKESEVSSTLEKISFTSSEMISELNDTVWAINPRNDNMAVIFQRMESFARPLLAAQNIQFSMSYDKQLNSLNLEMEVRKNFYLIFKEAVNNAVKYAECTALDVRIGWEGHKITMSIYDDGKGFDLSKTSEGYKSSDVYGGGNGLKNMQRRAKEMKGTLKMNSEPEKGTLIDLSFPIT